MPHHTTPDRGLAPGPLRAITADSLAELWPGVALVDVRSRQEYSTAFIPGSLNIPLEELPSRLTDLPDLPDTAVYLLCGSGKRSSQAARMLTSGGYATVNVAGGITEWYRGGHPVIYTPPPPHQAGQADQAHRANRAGLGRLGRPLKTRRRTPQAGCVPGPGPSRARSRTLLPAP
ncbi:rhodanese-like domain-containing protein [Arthrobacter sp. Soc17.1.1.1]|uniref:rhodanese-like domain-containing protein n=1 Tax=Arthrobacter sp. Soc17.1.1.1 TaxID=3121277 RepID=UPI002FE4CCD0